MLPPIALLCALAAGTPTAAEGVAPVPLVSAEAAAAGAEPERLLRDGEAVVNPAAHFAVVAGAPLADARLVLYDGQEALVEAEGTAEIGSSSSRFALQPASPLRPGGRYVLRLEGSQGRELHDLAGRAFRPLSFPLRAAGEPPREDPPRKAKKRSKRRPRA